MLPNYIQNACCWAKETGFKVFPTNANEKRPCINDPFVNATNVREEIIDIFSKFPGAGLGIPTGPLNQITVIDVDMKNNINGFAHLRALEEDIPTTGVVRTPSGGVHIYFETGNLAVPNSVSKIAPNNDVRGAGGYVQGPGTITKSGPYFWDVGFISTNDKLAKMPPGLLRRCMAPTTKDHSSSNWRPSGVKNQLLEPIYEGSRNDTMASRIGYLVKKLEPSEAFKAAQHINDVCCEPSLDDRELMRTFYSILKREMRNG